MGSEATVVELSADEALVLFDLLHRWEDEKRVSPPSHYAEQVALWNLSALLESALSGPLSPDYVRLVSDARARVAGA